MIARISAKIVEVASSSVVVEVSGIGYEVVLPKNLLLTVKIGDSKTFHIAENIKEDEYTLFGFDSVEARHIYYKLTSVNGVGPKAAMAILSAHSYAEVQNAILNDDVHLFSSVSGIGKKTAQRIILDLKGKLVNVGSDEVSSEDQAYQALQSLGYSAKDAREMLKGIDPSLPTQERIRLSLKGAKK
jgi:Holliday junction DNA helicase RuvA